MTEHVHVSDLRFDRLLAGELADDAATAVRAEAAGCARCSERLAALARDHAAFADRPFVVARPPVRRWWLAVPAVLAAAAALVLVLRAGPDAPGERVKGGGPQLIVAAGAADHVAPVASGDRIHPHDVVQAGYSAERAGFGAVLSRDGSGSASAYVPANGDTMVALPAGRERSFPSSTVLDEITGTEVIVVVWCETAHPLASLVAELRTRGDITPPAGCTHRRVVLDKRAEAE